MASDRVCMCPVSQLFRASCQWVPAVLTMCWLTWDARHQLHARAPGLHLTARHLRWMITSPVCVLSVGWCVSVDMLWLVIAVIRVLQVGGDWTDLYYKLPSWKHYALHFWLELIRMCGLYKFHKNNNNAFICKKAFGPVARHEAVNDVVIAVTNELVRHEAVNDVVTRAFVSASTAVTKEKSSWQGSMASDLTLIPWQHR